MKWVVFNADDFGASERTNRAVLRAHCEGLLTTTSLMVNEPAAEEAVRSAMATPSLGVGLHVVLSNGLSALPSAIAPQRQFTNDPALAGIRYYFSRAARKAVAVEVEEQFTQFAATRLPWSHVDGHQHLHMHPVVWDAVIQQCGAHEIRRIRIPCEEWRPRTHERLAARRMEWTFFRSLRRRCLRTLAGREFTVMDRVYGHLETGRMDRDYLLDLLPKLGGRTNEVYFHPGTPHARPTPDDAAMDVELAALLNPQVRERLALLDLRLTTFSQIDADARGK